MSAIGFDTSNYTASVSWTDGKQEKSVRQLLFVKEGEHGIRQSDGVFQHMKIVPKLFEEITGDIDMTSVNAVGVSVRPRNVEGSYMPVFLAGEGYAKVVSDTLGVPLYKFSHQDGHIMAGIYSCKSFELLEDDFISVHLSGGTTEILKSRYTGNNFTNEIIGGTKDISVGQFIDRVGVRMGMRFPAGKEIEKLAMTADAEQKLPVSVDGTYMNFSGVETKASRIAEECDKASLALGVLVNVGKTLTAAINCAVKNTNIHRVLIVGGVASNGIIRKMFDEKIDGKVYFAKPEYSCDNAVGIAYMTRIVHSKHI